MVNLMSFPELLSSGILFNLGKGDWAHRDIRNQFWFKFLKGSFETLQKQNKHLQENLRLVGKNGSYNYNFISH